MSRKNNKTITLNLSEIQIIEMYLLLEYLSNILSNRRIFWFFKYSNETLKTIIEPLEIAYNEREYIESENNASMTILSKDLNRFKRMLKHLQRQIERFLNKKSEKLTRLEEILCKQL